MLSWLICLFRYVLACPMPRSMCAEVLHILTCVVGACSWLESATFMPRPVLDSYPWRMLCVHSDPTKPILFKLEVEVAIVRGVIGSCGCQWTELIFLRFWNVLNLHFSTIFYMHKKSLSYIINCSTQRANCGMQMLCKLLNKPRQREVTEIPQLHLLRLPVLGKGE